MFLICKVNDGEVEPYAIIAREDKAKELFIQACSEVFTNWDKYNENDQNALWEQGVEKTHDGKKSVCCVILRIPHQDVLLTNLFRALKQLLADDNPLADYNAIRDARAEARKAIKDAEPQMRLIHQ